MTRPVLAAFAATIILGVAAAADHAVTAASGFVEQVPVAVWGAVGVIVAAWLGYLGTTRSRTLDSLGEWREWDEDFRESEKECRIELGKVRVIAEDQRRQIAVLSAEVEQLTVQVARLQRQIHGEETL